MNNIRFINKPELLESESDSSFIVHLKRVKNEEELFIELSSKLQFPDYFGYNWNAVYDCLRDLHWIEQKTSYFST